MMSPSERKALSACLCEDCGGLVKLPDVTLPAQLLRWCICAFEELGEEKAKEPMGFGVKTRASGESDRGRH